MSTLVEAGAMERARLRRAVADAMPPGATVARMDARFDPIAMSDTVNLAGDVLGHPFVFVCLGSGRYQLDIDGAEYGRGMQSMADRYESVQRCGELLHRFHAGLKAREPAPASLTPTLTAQEIIKQLAVHLREAADALDRITL